ncbi:uncharacterized protein KLLA0_D10109g [Kluyveromyces lactis]|uniref:KLLA0D10109p n=1 Tax=Kluyveromyces lactis (strain ATCC 8585 / CBS 2359 / DSM 70799 / NBRC 1267 / NRRL Y-1140 / WM37) TaxID=284590 RepID=Q6CRC8_KLULA|nr:uncharacterized protein KLLA0_D10109g [Kluyveromyces lactis]CAH00607.1 KLLA0D10109p [Kluyveromyces lactis]|eukprot:XP_453511.1 uncharacterized protein KLLA0_D10109g [Kluyveromyces lactis]
MTSPSGEFPSLKLNTGASIPQLGFGTWPSSHADAYTAVITALKTGYRHIDAAAMYGNEAAVGKGIRDSGIPREEIFVTTKLWNTQQRDPASALDESLERLGLDYVDLFLIHWPVPLKPVGGPENLLKYPTPGIKPQIDTEDWSFIKTWELMQTLPKTGKTRAVGVSNFSIKNLEDLLNSSPDVLVPAVNQFEIHPQLPQTELINYCKSKGIVVEAYCPLGSSSSAMLSDPTIAEIADKYHVKPANVLINWGISRGYCVLPKSFTPARIASNKTPVHLSREDTERITKLSETLGVKRYVHPDFEPYPLFE